MQGFLTICAVMGALGLAACGSPSELDEDAFPTGYAAAGSSGTTQDVTRGQGGSAGAVASSGGSSGSLANGGGAGSSTGACPSDITVLFNRPIALGGCTQDGGGCHEAGSVIKPDLVSPNVAARLLNMPSKCSRTSTGMSVQPRPYIGKDDSFLEEKIAGTVDSSCGYSMPFLQPDKLSAADRQCIIQWIDQVSGG